MSPSENPSWYLDPLAAEQKRRVHQELVERWRRGTQPSRVLKTDVFEEAYGLDRVLFDLFDSSAQVLGMDLDPATAARAARSAPGGFHFLASDVVRLAVRSGSLDLVLSHSTLDHLDSDAQFREALAELYRALAPGGRLIITTDNPLNPLYLPLKLYCRRRSFAFRLGFTTSLRGLMKRLKSAGFEVLDTDYLVHNPRGISTLLFLLLRRLLGRKADGPIGFLLTAFSLLGRLPTRRLTACWVAACAAKPAESR